MGAVNSCFHRCTAPIASMVCAGRGWLGNLGQRSFGVGPSGGGAAGTTGGGGAASTAGAPPLLCGGFGKRVPKIRRCGFHEVFHERRTSAQGSARSSDLARFYRERDSQNSHFGTPATFWRTGTTVSRRIPAPRCGGAANGAKEFRKSDLWLHAPGSTLRVSRRKTTRKVFQNFRKFPRCAFSTGGVSSHGAARECAGDGPKEFRNSRLSLHPMFFFKDTSRRRRRGNDERRGDSPLRVLRSSILRQRAAR